MLLSLGADANKRDKNGSTPLHYACSCKKAQYIDITRILLANGGAQVTAIANDGSSALHHFIQRDPSKDYVQFMDTIKLMISEGADINAQTKSGETLLHISVAQGNYNLVEFLLQQNVELDRRTKYVFIQLLLFRKFIYLFY